MKRDSIVTVLAFLFYFYCMHTGVSLGTVYYVAADGNDLNPGNESLPWATIQKAANTMRAGDKVIVKPGVYAGNVDTVYAGTSTAPITYYAQRNVGRVTINAKGKDNGFICDQPYIVIDGFEIIAAGTNGISFKNDAGDFSIARNCEIHGVTNGIKIDYADNITIENCLIYGNKSRGILAGNNADGLIVKNCTIYGNVEDGIKCSGSDTAIIDTIITDNGLYGIASYGTVAINVSYSDIWSNASGNYDNTSKIHIGTGVINADPLYIDAASFNFRLNSGSPCIGTASDGNDMGYSYPPNRAPVADAGPDRTLRVNEPTTFDGSGSSDPDGDALTYSWDFGDGSTGSGPIVTHTYSGTVGTSYTITLTVEDTWGHTATDTCVRSIVENIPPVADAGSDRWVYAGDSVSFSGSGSSDPEGDALTYEWDFGDGTTGSGIGITHIYNDANTYTVTLTVNDGWGGIDSDSCIVTVKDKSGAAPAFPGAEGAGKWSAGGRGGKVYEVNSLNDSGPGTLREAINASGPRIVVFRVSGTIALLSNLTIRNPYITIAGQTAPGDGICLKDRSFVISADHVIIRYLRARTGDNAGLELDTITAGKGQYIILDHCSATWGIDETLSTSAYSGLDKVTVQWCLIAESLNCSVHSEGCHGYGTLAKGGFGAQYTYHHNLYAHHSGRSPYPGNYNRVDIDPQGLTFDFCNNVIYNWGGDFAGYNTQGGHNSVTRMNFIGNYYKQGINSTANKAFFQRVTTSKGYFSSNWMNNAYPADPWNIVIFDEGWTQEQIDDFKLSSPTPVNEPVTMDDAQTAYERVLTDVGATLPRRDSVDTRIINSVIDGTGRIIDDEDQVGGWPQLNSTTPPADSDHDGMPDKWEIARGLNPNDVNDNKLDRDGDGYTNVEEYLNYLVARRTESPPDFDNDGDVDWDDLADFVNDWLVSDCFFVPVGDLDGDCDVDWKDFARFAKSWSN